MPLDFEEASEAAEAAEAAEVERVEALFLPGVSCPGLASIQQGGENAHLIDEDLGSLAQQAVVPHSLVELGHDSGSFGDARTDL